MPGKLRDEGYESERNTVLTTGTEEEVERFLRKYDITLPRKKLDAQATIHAAKIENVALPEAQRRASREWLREYGYLDLADDMAYALESEAENLLRVPPALAVVRPTTTTASTEAIPPSAPQVTREGSGVGGDVKPTE